MAAGLRLLALTKYGHRGASSRYRLYQYIPFLNQLGWEIVSHPLFPDKYLDTLYGMGRRSAWGVTMALLKRLRSLTHLEAIRSFTAIWVEGELLTYLPYIFEKRFYRRHANVVVDYDDAIFVRYENLRWLRSKIARIMSDAGEVVVGNGYLADYARRCRPHVNQIPTVVDVSFYEPRTSYGLGDKVVIGWIGTPMTSFLLDLYSRALRELAAKYPIVLRCVGTAPDFTMPGVQVENLPWDERTQGRLVSSFDIGVMPLQSDGISLGKCGLKLIQYMACGVPAVGSAVGANTEIISDGVNGFTVHDEGELIRKIELLIRSEPMRRSLGRAGRATVESRYSLQLRASELDAILRKAGGRTEAAGGDPAVRHSAVKARI